MNNTRITDAAYHMGTWEAHN